MTRPRHFVTKTATCPSCEATVWYRKRRGVRRPVAKFKRCSECDEVWR